MSNLLHASEQLEREFVGEPIGKPMLAAFLFHALLAGAVLGYAMFNGMFQRNSWGGASEGSAIAVQLVSRALPLPADQKPNDNVLATEKPSEAPAPPAPKTLAAVDEKAIAIPSKVEAPKKIIEKKQETTKTPQRQQPPKQDNRAQFGEQASTQMERATQPANSTTLGPATVSSNGSKGFNYPFYVEAMVRKMVQNTNKNEVDPKTPKGAQSNILFTIRRDGSVTEIKIDRSSGSPTLDKSCLRGAQRVDTFGPLPSPQGDGPLLVSYHCDYN